MNERRDNAFGQTAKPTIEYHLDKNDSRFPFVFEINGDKLGQLLVEEMGFSEERVRDLVFRVTSMSIPIGLSVSVTPEGIQSGLQVLHGRTRIEEGESRNRIVVDIHTGGISESLKRRRDIMVDYSFLAKQNDLPPDMERIVSINEEQVLTNKGERWNRYLKAANWRRVAGFLDRLSVLEFNKEVTGVIVHEAHHIDDVMDLENIGKRVSKRGVIKTLAVRGGAIMILLGTVRTILGDQDGAVIDWVIAASAFGGAVLAKTAQEKSEKELLNLQQDSETRASLAAKEKGDRWRDVLVVRPNPNYYG